MPPHCSRKIQQRGAPHSINSNVRQRIPGRSRNIPRSIAWLIRYGRAEGALTILEHRARQGRVPYEFLRLAPEFKSLAGNERFVRVRAVARAQLDDIIALLREADARSELPAFLRQPLSDLLRTLGISGGPVSESR